MVNKILLFLKKIIESHSGISSKRVCGVLGWLSCMLVMFYCTYTNKQAPNMIDTVLICCLGLLGVDSITDIWKNKIK